MWWILLAACTGLDREPEEVAVVDAATEASVDGTEAAEPDSEAPGVVTPLASAGLTAELGAELAAEVAGARAELDAVSSSAELAAVHARVLSLSERLGAHFENKPEDAPVDTLIAEGPGLEMNWVAEGTMRQFVPSTDAWTAAAARTPEIDDDAFIALVSYVYGSAAPFGWQAWQERNWDYGGCSGLGRGMVLETLKRADAAEAAGDSFGLLTARIRAEAIEEVTRTGESLFPRCNVETMEPMPNEQLRGEVDQILADIQLTPDERKALQDAKPRLEGQEFQGG